MAGDAGRRARAAIPKRPSRLRLWLRRRRALLRPALVTAIGLLALGALASALMSFDPGGRVAALWESAADLAGEGGLRVEEVTLEGHRNTPQPLLREALGVAQGDPILAFDPRAARERLELIAWISRAHVERRLPNRILVRIEERQPFAVWQQGGQFAVIDREGRVVETADIGAFGRLPLVVGAGADRTAAPIVDLLRASQPVSERTHALVRIADRRWNLRLRNGTDVLLPERHEAAAIARLEELQARQGLLDRPLAAIDLRLPDKLVLRPTPVAGPPPPPEPARPARSRG